MTDLTATVARVLLIAEDGTRAEVETVCEPINEWLCVTPCVGAMRDGSVVLAGGFNVTHIPSGYAACQGYGCISCARNVGKALAELDWASAPAIIDKAAYTAWLNNHPESVTNAIWPVFDLSWSCDADDCEADEV